MKLMRALGAAFLFAVFMLEANAQTAEEKASVINRLKAIDFAMDQIVLRRDIEVLGNSKTSFSSVPSQFAEDLPEGADSVVAVMEIIEVIAASLAVGERYAGICEDYSVLTLPPAPTDEQARLLRRLDSSHRIVPRGCPATNQVAVVNNPAAAEPSNSNALAAAAAATAAQKKKIEEQLTKDQLPYATPRRDVLPLAIAQVGRVDDVPPYLKERLRVSLTQVLSKLGEKKSFATNLFVTFDSTSASLPPPASYDASTSTFRVSPSYLRAALISCAAEGIYPVKQGLSELTSVNSVAFAKVYAANVERANLIDSCVHMQLNFLVARALAVAKFPVDRDDLADCLGLAMSSSRSLGVYDLLVFKPAVLNEDRLSVTNAERATLICRSTAAKKLLASKVGDTTLTVAACSAAPIACQ